MRYTLITQIVLTLLSVVLIFTFLKPAFADIKKKQDDLFLYKDTLLKVEELNQALQALIAKRNSFSGQDQYVLNTFIPDTLDSVKVMRDIDSIFNTANIELLSLTPSEPVIPQISEAIQPEAIDEFGSAIVTPPPTASSRLVTQDFVVAFIGSYAETKTILQFIEQNETLLEVMDFSLTPSAEGEEESAKKVEENSDQFMINLTLRTFASHGKPNL